MNPAFVSHASVRIKGTENNYEPVSCSDPQCVKSWPHMHCPFCVKTDTFQDPVILKAHYRVKHVDKGIDFAGLKILRCCEHCDIVGTIKGTKEFKGAHWHCYKCRNGFTRRDEAIKHYRTHFRNPSTTFQIQVTQDINQSHKDGVGRVNKERIVVDGQSSVPQPMTFIETVITSVSNENHGAEEADLSLQSDVAEAEPSKSSSGDLQVSVAANETVGTCEGQTIMIIPSSQSEHTVRTVEAGEVVHTIESQEDLQTFLKQQKMSVIEVPEEKPRQDDSSPEVHEASESWQDERESLLEKIGELNAQVSELSAEKASMEQNLKSEIDSLRVQVQVASTSITSYQKRETELLNQLKIPLGNRLSGLLAGLKQQHEELLHQQLAQLRQEHLAQTLSQDLQREDDQVIHVDVASLVRGGTDGPHMIVAEDNGQSYGSIPPSVLTSQALISDGGSSATTQLFVVPTSTELRVKDEQHVQHEPAEVYQEEMGQVSAAPAEMDFVESEIVTAGPDGERVILLHAPEQADSHGNYSEGVDTEHLEISAEGTEQVLTLHSNKRVYEDDGDDLTNQHKHKQRKGL